MRERDLQPLLEVFLSNPDYLDWTEGGQYDLQKLRLDWDSADRAPGRHMLALHDKARGELVGVLEYMENNARDGHPWIGLIMVRADRQREGLAGEAMEAVASHINLNWASPLRLGVIEQNQAGLGLAISLGFQPYGETEQHMDAGMVRIVLLQRRV